MYWGHAASKDMVHWTHLPVVLEPQEEILDNLAIKGGAFSGSALPMGDKVYFYLTRHIGPQDDGWDTVQYQTMTKSSDMIHFEPEKEIGHFLNLGWYHNLTFLSQDSLCKSKR